jgi:dephospho-CoA kinase
VVLLFHCSSFFLRNLAMRLIGLTGGIACGKSSLLREFRQCNIPVINADDISKELMQPGQSVYRNVTRHFAHHDILDATTGMIDREKLGAIIFADAKLRSDLNRLTHGPIMMAMFWRVVQCWIRREPLVILELPLLFQVGAHRIMAALVVYTDEETQIRRLLHREPRLTRDDALKRIAAQIPVAQQRAMADFTFDNNADNIDQAQVKHCLHQLATTYKPRALLFDAALSLTVLSLVALVVMVIW